MTILFFCEPTDVRSLWSEYYTYMVEDYPSTNTFMSINLTNMYLRDLNGLLMQHGKQITNFNLPT